MVELDDTQKAILTALTSLTEPSGCGVIGKQAGLPTPKVVPKMRGLLNSDLVERPVKGKYVISEQGRAAL
jgi:predicted transcriptional regulator